MTRMIITFDHPATTTTLDMSCMSTEARRPSDAAKSAMECGSKRCGDLADRVVYTETVLGRDGYYYRGYRRSRGPAGTEVWVRR